MRLRTLAIASLAVATIAASVWLWSIYRMDGGGPVGDHQTLAEELREHFPAAAPGAMGASAGELRKQWDSKFDATKRRLRRDREAAGAWACDGCGFRPGIDGDGQLDWHHVISVNRIADEGLPVELIWDPKNLVLACRREGWDGRECGCHWTVGHRDAGKSNWSLSNRNVRNDLATKKRTNPFRN